VNSIADDDDDDYDIDDDDYCNNAETESSNEGKLKQRE